MEKSTRWILLAAATAVLILATVMGAMAEGKGGYIEEDLAATQAASDLRPPMIVGVLILIYLGYLLYKRYKK